MLANRISDLFQIKNRYLRSAHLERDFADPAALRGYVVTPPAAEALERLARGLSPKSGQRAWRVTGDYGTGKSSFALALAHLFTDGGSGAPPAVRQAVDFREVGVRRPNLLPVLVTGSQDALSERLLLAVAAAIEGAGRKGKPPAIVRKLRGLPEDREAGRSADARGVELLREAARHVRESGKGDGLLIVLDELGKFLEFAAVRPDRQDVHFLQSLAEAAARSGETPIFVVALLHQGFHAYAEQLTLATQREWEKVAGRFDEILFDQPLEQTAFLVANALNVRRDRLPRGAATALERDMGRAVDIGWFGPGVVRKRLTALAADLYPLHPSVVPVLVRLFSRYGQNERSLYSFLLSNEPNGLLSFAEAAPKGDSFYRLHHLYDYVRAAFGHRLALQSSRSHWNQIESVVGSFSEDQAADLRILKAVAVLNLIDSPALLATDEAIGLAIGGNAPEEAVRVKKALKGLQRGKSVLYYRGAAGGYCLWPHTSVNLDRVYQAAEKAVPVPTRVAPHIRDHLETRPLVARRHYIETGNLRHFDVAFAAPEDLAGALDAPGFADGRVLVALCETDAGRREAVRFAKSPPVAECPDVLVAVPQPLMGLAGVVAEVLRWEWVLGNTAELNHDAYAHEEVTRRLTACRQMLTKRLHGFVGIRQFVKTPDLEWFHRGEAASLPTGRAVLKKLSAVCDAVYREAPRINNELVNRHSLSSAAAAARMRLIERIASQAAEPLLGMDPATKPPEMSMYLSVLKAAKVHRQVGDQWTLAVPEEGDDPCRLRPILTFMREFLESHGDARVRLPDLLGALRRAPFGIRDGMGPLLVAVFASIHEQEVAFYENGGFVKRMTGQEFQRLSKFPGDFALQYCRVAGVRAAVFKRLYEALHPGKAPGKRIDLLDVVRPLCVFAAQLPVYVLKTSSLSPTAAAVRDALARAEDPALLVFHTLPEACGCGSIGNDAPLSPQMVKRYVDRLREAIDELSRAYPELLRKMRDEFCAAFDRPGSFEEIRTGMSASARHLQASLAEPRLKAFCLRLADDGLGEEKWLESLGSYVCSKNPDKWTDQDLARYQEDVARYSRQFRRVESAAVSRAAESTSVTAMRVSITRDDGTEVDEVVRLDSSEVERVAELERAILKLVKGESRLGVLAASRALWAQLHDQGSR